MTSKYRTLPMLDCIRSSEGALEAGVVGPSKEVAQVPIVRGTGPHRARLNPARTVACLLSRCMQLYFSGRSCTSTLGIQCGSWADPHRKNDTIARGGYKSEVRQALTRATRFAAPETDAKRFALQFPSPTVLELAAERPSISTLRQKIHVGGATRPVANVATSCTAPPNPNPPAEVRQAT